MHDDHDDHEEDREFLWKMNVLVLIFFLSFLLDVFIERKQFVGNLKKGSGGSGDFIDQSEGHGHGHSHSHANMPFVNMTNSTPISICNFSNIKTAVKKVSTLLIGDILHNFVDGIALATAFSESTAIGVGTSIAVFMHELPHEIADFMIYFQKTESFGIALLLNGLSALCCFVGLLVGFAVNELDGVNEYLLLAAAGSFIYITVTHILPELGLARTGKDYSFTRKMVLFIFGSLAGWACMFVLAWYEHELTQVFE